MNKNGWLYLGIGAGTAILIGIIVYLVVHIFSLNETIKEEKKKAQLWSDSLKIVVTELGEIYEKHAEESSLQAGIIAQLNHNLKLALSLASQAPVQVSSDENILFALHEPTYKDQGLIMQIKDSVWFTRSDDGGWISDQRLHLKGEVFLEQTVGRDSTGNFFGRVETKSKALKLTVLNTHIDNKFNPKTSFKVSPTISSGAHILGIAADIDFRSFATGIAFNIGNYQFSTKYILVSQDISREQPWYERLRVGGVYYIW